MPGEVVVRGRGDRTRDERVARDGRERRGGHGGARRGHRGAAFVHPGRHGESRPRRLDGEPQRAGGGGQLAVELRAQQLVDLLGGQRRRSVVGHGVLRVGRRAPSAGFPSRSANAARPRAMRERTVPGGIPSTSAISA
ncbi:MAG: hypothetical protein KatS3mg009_0477 [Acidimicrobiia bacterium]|nr:MAG: hypothetical protein KatS3mg009_0477 [Acidimicrobiia bacterium]